MSLLEVQDLRVTFGGSVAVDNVALNVDAGMLVGLIGPNGAGKSTTVDAITGFVPSIGQVRFAGTSLQGQRGFGRSRSPHRRARLGLARTWQGADLFLDLTVMDNLRVAGPRHSDADHRRTLFSLGIGDIADAAAQSLSHGQRTVVGVARALATQPSLICLDEPASGLGAPEIDFLGRRIRAIANEGTAVVLIDHDMGLVLGICDVVYVMDFGRIIAVGRPEAIRHDPRVLDAYLGSRHSRGAAPSAAPGDGLTYVPAASRT